MRTPEDLTQLPPPSDGSTWDGLPEQTSEIVEQESTLIRELRSEIRELSRSNRELVDLMAATEIATISLDCDLRILRYTPPALELFRLIPADVGRPLFDLTTHLDHLALAADAAGVLENLRPLELEVAHSDGRHFLARLLPCRTTDDRVAGVVLTFVDITRRREAEADLRAGEQRFRTVVDLVPDLLFSTDAEGNLTWCNQRWTQYTGQTLAEAQGSGWTKCVYADDRTEAGTKFGEGIRLGEAFRSEHRLVDVNGNPRWFLVRAEPVHDAGGQIIQWFGAKTDVQAIQRSSTQLAASEERLRLIIENAREFAIFSMDREMHVTFWNPGAERLLGYSEEEILGQDADIIFTPEDRAGGAPQAEARGAIANGRASDERWHLRKDGSRFWGSGAMMRMNDASGQAIGLVKILRDETQARQSREALEKSRLEMQKALEEAERAHAEAEAASRAKDRFLAVLSHELRTPLTPIIMAVSMLSLSRNLPESAREALEMIERNVKIEAHFIDDLLDISRIVHGKLELDSEPMDLHEAIRRAVEVSTGDIEGRSQRLTVELRAEKRQVHGDATRLQQLFWNLLKNASKFTPDGGNIRLTSHNEPDWVVVEVEDTGIGFEPDVAQRIFEAFEQANLDVTRQFGGLGLGLAISKATADAHGGTLRARSDGPDKGATFSVELPLLVDGVLPGRSVS